MTGAQTPTVEVKPTNTGAKFDKDKYMQCPVCDDIVRKAKNTCYCPSHKVLMDAMLRQSKSEDSETHKTVLKTVKTGGDGLKRLVHRFQAECCQGAAGRPRPRFNFIQWLQVERQYLRVEDQVGATPRTKRQCRTECH